MRLRALASAALVGAAVLPDRAVHDGPVLCLFRRVTGVPCPSCGLTRSWQALGHGRVSDSFRYHPFGPLTVLLALWLVTDERAERRLAVGSQRWGTFAATGWIAAWVWRLRRSG